jgi:UDP-glucuronate 4-epimerase
MTKILITGIAGFIGFHLARALVKTGVKVVGVDNFNNYYDVDLKKHRAKLLKKLDVDIEKLDIVTNRFSDYVYIQKPDVIIHLAASVGVRHSYDHAQDYIINNILGTQSVIQTAENNKINKVIYASTSCVMAGNPLPWQEDVPTGHQLNAYGYTKRTNECQFMTSRIANTIGLRFFTVYGPYGRPDMALFQFANAAVNNKPIDVFNNGDMKRDFTYVDDIVAGIQIILNRILKLDNPEHEIYNIGRGQQVNLMDFIAEIEKNFDKKLEKNFLPRHPADTLETWSDTSKIQALGWKPTTSIPEGVANFAQWYKYYYGVN